MIRNDAIDRYFEVFWCVVQSTPYVGLLYSFYTNTRYNSSIQLNVQRAMATPCRAMLARRLNKRYVVCLLLRSVQPQTSCHGKGAASELDATVR